MLMKRYQSGNQRWWEITRCFLGSMSLCWLCSGASAQSTTVDMVWLPGKEPAVGASILTRHDDSVEMSVHTTGLEPGHVYTVWWVVFNNPDACSDECDENDVPMDAPGYKEGQEPPDPAVQASMIWATGLIVGADGTADFRARLEVGDTTSAVEFGPSLIDPMNAEIHLPVRSHGRAVKGRVAKQISTKDGLCELTKPDPGSSKCLNVQVATHMPY
jgi:hypothetical protein